MLPELARVLLGHAREADGEAPADLRAQPHARLVGRHDDVGAVLDPAPARVLVRELDLRAGALELELGYALDGRAREQRPIAHEPEPGAARDGLAGGEAGAGAVQRRARAGRGSPPHLAERGASEDAPRHLRADVRGGGGEGEAAA